MQPKSRQVLLSEIRQYIQVGFGSEEEGQLLKNHFQLLALFVNASNHAPLRTHLIRLFLKEKLKIEGVELLVDHFLPLHHW